MCIYDLLSDTPLSLESILCNLSPSFSLAGVSLGGMHAWLAAALDERISAAAPLIVSELCLRSVIEVSLIFLQTAHLIHNKLVIQEVGLTLCLEKIVAFKTMMDSPLSWRLRTGYLRGL